MKSVESTSTLASHRGAPAPVRTAMPAYDVAATPPWTAA